MNTTRSQKLERSVAHSALYERNRQNFKNLGLIDPKFVIKFAYVPKHREDMVVSMFPNEMKDGRDIYMELTDGDNRPFHENPVLYRLRHNPFYKDGEYEIIPADPSRNKNAETYLIPISELEIVAGSPTPGAVPLSVTKKPVIEPSPQVLSTANLDFKKPVKEQEDAHYSELTIRDLAAILLKQPVSNKPWLNTIITTQVK